MMFHFDVFPCLGMIINTNSAIHINGAKYDVNLGSLDYQASC